MFRNYREKGSITAPRGLRKICRGNSFLQKGYKFQVYGMGIYPFNLELVTCNLFTPAGLNEGDITTFMRRP
jgi:hypothetical protein